MVKLENEHLCLVQCMWDIRLRTLDIWHTLFYTTKLSILDPSPTHFISLAMNQKANNRPPSNRPPLPNCCLFQTAVKGPVESQDRAVDIPWIVSPSLQLLRLDLQPWKSRGNTSLNFLWSYWRRNKKKQRMRDFVGKARWVIPNYYHFTSPLQPLPLPFSALGAGREQQKKKPAQAILKKMLKFG